MAGQPIRLKYLLRERHWQTYRTFCIEYDKVAEVIDPTLKGTWPSRTQLHRWLSGDLKGLPYPDHCRILEGMFPGWTVAQMFEPYAGERLALSAEVERPTETFLAQLPPSFPTDALLGIWVTCYQFGRRFHADLAHLTVESDRYVSARNHPPEPRSDGRATPFHNEIEAQLANRHIIGHWKNTSDTRYFGSLHLAVLPGETVMDGYYTSFASDILVGTGRWKWVRLDVASLAGVELSQVMLREPAALRALVDGHSQYDAPLALAAVGEVI